MLLSIHTTYCDLFSREIICRKNEKMKKNISFSCCNFLSHSGTISGAVIVLVVLTAGLLTFPTASRALESCGEENTGEKKIMIAYDSKHGSTILIVNKMGEVLCEDGFQVDMEFAAKIDDISSYDAVVVGSPIYWATFLPGTILFLSTHKDTLGTIPVAVFAVSTYVDPETGLVYEDALVVFINPILAQFPQFTPLDPIGLIPGQFSFRELYPFELLSMRSVPYEEYDYLNLDVAGAWAEEIGELLQ